MKALMMPMQAAPGPEIGGGRPLSGRDGGQADFAGHLEDRIARRRGEESNLLGLRRQEMRAAVGREEGRLAGDDAQAAAGKGAKARQEELTALLGQYLGLIQQEAEDLQNGPGQWQFTIEDPAQLAALAAAAGMSEADTTALLESFEQNDGVFEMGQFLARLSRHFQNLENEQPVPVPETDLPYLQLLLSKLGVPAGQVEKIGEAAVQGNNTLDLAALLQELEKLGLGSGKLGGEGLPDGELAKSGDKPTPANGEMIKLDQQITLTGWNAEQLQKVLEAAGVSQALQRELLPELHSPWDQPQRPKQPLKLDLERFYELLQRGVAEVRAARPQAEIPEFLAQLKEIFARAGFAEQRQGWDPAIQGAVEKIYSKLLESVDLATVRVDRGERFATLKDELNLEKFATLDKDIAANREAVRQAMLQAGLGGGGDDFSDEETFSGRFFLQELREGQGRAGERAEMAAFSVEVNNADQQRQDLFRALNSPARAQAQLEQQVFNRISNGIATGLQRNEHHLVLHLHPRELGEVRVEMLVRDNQVSLSFSMDSHRVREIVEKNMDMFRENLERRGFQIGECMVSVDQHDRQESADAWQRFVSSWTNQRGGGVIRPETLAELPEKAPYQRPAGRENGIDLFA